MASPLTMTVNEIVENWRTAELSAEDDWEFLRELHDPKTNARKLLDDQCFVRPDFTDAQWAEVLVRLRDEFPNKTDCEECYDPACGTYGPNNVPLCADCRDDGGWCSCGEKMDECPDCGAAEVTLEDVWRLCPQEDRRAMWFAQLEGEDEDAVLDDAQEYGDTEIPNTAVEWFAQMNHEEIVELLHRLRA